MFLPYTVFPDVMLSNAYLILRPFFRPISNPVSEDALDPKNWEFGMLGAFEETGCLNPYISCADVSHPEFPGILRQGEHFFGPRINDESHPHLKVSESMVSVPHVRPGDMVYWHCVRLMFHEMITLSLRYLYLGRHSCCGIRTPRQE